MLIIKSPSNDPYYNIASEEYILETFQEDVFLLYINNPSIIVGKYQNTISQLNVDYINDNKIKVVRRLTGGGAVFHDLGNINFAFLCKRDDAAESGFERYTKPIIAYLNTLGVQAELKGRNDLMIGEKKFSGNARLTTADKVLQHGTLLYSAKMNNLALALKSDPLKFKDKAVKSVRSRVTNISDHLAEPLSGQDFENGLIEYITSTYQDTKLYVFNETDQGKISQLAETKYSTWKWNFGSSPEYNFHKSLKTKGGIIEIRLSVQKGTIKDIKLNGDFFTKLPVERIINALINCRHDVTAVKEIINCFKIEDYLINITGDDLLEALF